MYNKNNDITSLQMVRIYACIIVVALLIINLTTKHHLSDDPAPSPKEVKEYQIEDSAKFRTMQRAANGETDYVIPDSAINR